MARPLRPDYADTFYHVLSRGNERRDIFYGKQDYVQFLEVLGRVVERHPGKPQYRSLLRGQDARALALEILGQLGERDPASVLHRRRIRSVNRDLAIYVLYQLGVYRNEDIGKAFGVGYTAVTAAVSRAREHLGNNVALEQAVKRILNDK